MAAAKKGGGGGNARKPSVSVVVPTYNERENIPLLLAAIERAFADRDYEIIVVDDSSPDGTGAQVLSRARRNPRVRLVRRECREGIGAALREGYDAARKDIILSTDADFPFPPRRLRDILAMVEGGCDLVVASRHGKHGAYEKGSARTWLKYVLSRAGNWLFTLGLPVHDLTINFRGMRRSAWRAIETRDKGNAFLAEMIIKAHRQGYKVAEIGMRMKDRTRGESKLRIAREAPRSAAKVLRYRLFR